MENVIVYHSSQEVKEKKTPWHIFKICFQLVRKNNNSISTAFATLNCATINLSKYFLLFYSVRTNIKNNMCNACGISNVFVLLKAEDISDCKNFALPSVQRQSLITVHCTFSFWSSIYVSLQKMSLTFHHLKNKS